jgi:hypothetical protein
MHLHKIMEGGRHAGAAIGTVLSHFLDPQEGQRRRTEIKDKAVSMGKSVQDATRRRIEDLNSRVGRKGLNTSGKVALTTDFPCILLPTAKVQEDKAKSGSDHIIYDDVFPEGSLAKIFRNLAAHEMKHSSGIAVRFNDTGVALDRGPSASKMACAFFNPSAA